MAGPFHADGRLHLEVLPAKHGDCLLLRWGTATGEGRMLIDVGPAEAYEAIATRLRALDDRHIDMLVLTHIDTDHIEGTILLANDASLGLSIGEIWYNGAPQLTSELKPVHGEILGTLIAQRAIAWNAAFGGGPVYAPETGNLLVRELAGGLRLTVLAPGVRSLRRLRDAWEETCRKEGLPMGSVAGALAALKARPSLIPAQAYLSRPPAMDVRKLARSRAGSDNSIPNASSIVLLVEYGQLRILLTGDVTPAALTAAVGRLLAERELDSLPLTAFKIPHHGSAKNITADLVRRLPADHYVFSADGSHFGHPHDSAVATVLEYGPAQTELVFNYDTPRMRQWDDDRLRDTYCYQVRYPNAGEAGVGLVWRRAP